MRIFPLASGRVFLPDYSDAALLATLGTGTSTASIQEAIAAWKAGARDEALRHVVDHFDRRTHPRFFFDIVDARVLASAIARTSSGWQDRLERWTAAVTTDALEVYGRPVAPLKPGFPWAGHRSAAQDDLLFAARPHRFAFAPTLACATLVGCLPPGRFQDVLVDWCQFATADRSGLAFVSNLVVTQRLIASSWAYALLGPAAGDAPIALLKLKWKLLKVMSQDVAFLRPRLGSSYPNNHLLMDRFAAWYIATLFPELGFDTRLLAKAEALWIGECEDQTYPDGGYFEPSVRYHGLAAELLSAYVVLARRQGQNPPERVEARLEAMLRFQARLAGSDGQPPEFGDGTEDQVFPLPAASGCSSALSALYRILFTSGASAMNDSARGYEWAFWMLGGRIPARERVEPPVGFTAFPDTGLFVFSESAEATRLVLRTAPAPERRVMPGHMHSDLMSVYLVASETPLLVDSGTFSYRFDRRSTQHGAANWRVYFTGAPAHNTVLLGSQDPLPPLEGDFRPNTEVPRATTLGYRASARLAVAAARLDTPSRYAGLVRGVLHVCDEYFLIWCVLPPKEAPEEARFLFQLAPGTAVESGPGHLNLARAGISTALTYSSGLEPEAIRQGSHEPIAGWVSPRYGEMVAAPQLTLRVANGRHLSAIVFRRGGQPSISSIGCDTVMEDVHAIRIQCAGFSDLLVLNIGRNRGRRVVLGRTSFEGEVLWVRESAEGALALRALATRAVTLPEHGVALSADGDRADFDYLKQP